MTAQEVPSPGNDWFASALVEEVDSFDEWREAATASAQAYTRWAEAPSHERANCYFAYTAALDQEQSAAIVYAMAVAEVERCVEHRPGRETSK
jgi:acyl-CoA reductase-like NAD-dependent aldehyde dehydrogenase